MGLTSYSFRYVALNLYLHTFLKVQLYYNENEYPSNTLCSSFDSSRASKDMRLLRYKLELGLFGFRRFFVSSQNL